MTTHDDSASIDEVNEAYLKVPLHRQMGLKIHERGPHTIVTMELSDAVSGAVAIPGSVHGGILATFADVSSAAALWGSFELGSEIPVTTDIHVRYYRQPRSGPLTAEVNLVHRGRRLLSTECSIADAEQRVLARSTATYMVVPIPASGEAA
jgi:uncharacterized protein (TIGR00369 family)